MSLRRMKIIILRSVDHKSEQCRFVKIGTNYILLSYHSYHNNNISIQI